MPPPVPPSAAYKDGKIVQVLTNVRSPDGDSIDVIYMRQDASGKTTAVTFATYERIKDTTR